MGSSFALKSRPKTKRSPRRRRVRHPSQLDMGATAGMPLFLQRSSLSPSESKSQSQQSPAQSECPGYQPRERTTSRTDSAHLDPDVSLQGPGKLLISDFGVNQTRVKDSTREEPLLKYWLATFENDRSYRLRIIGYSDCVDDADTNINLRHGRAEQVENLLGSSARSRVTFRGMQALGQYITNNNSTSTRAKNRSVIIEFHREISFSDEEAEAITANLCGPEVTQWLIRQMNANKNHPVIKTNRENSWVWYIPFVNIGWLWGFFNDFKDLVKAGAPWDFKASQSFRSTTCPASCPRTVTICNMCFDYDVPGNIHYGWVGRAGGIRRWFLHNRAAAAQKGGVDDPGDSVAIDIGINIWDKGKGLCDELRSKRAQLRRGDESCVTCSDNYT